MYYMLEEKPIEDTTDLADMGRSPKIPGVDWYAGERFSSKITIPKPLHFELDPEASGPLPWFFKVGISLMHDDMIEALHEVELIISTPMKLSSPPRGWKSVAGV